MSTTILRGPQRDALDQSLAYGSHMNQLFAKVRETMPPAPETWRQLSKPYRSVH